VPYAVSLVSLRCAAPNNVLRVVDNDAIPTPDVDFTVCVTPLNFHFDDVNRLVEFVEVRDRLIELNNNNNNNNNMKFIKRHNAIRW